MSLSNCTSSFFYLQSVLKCKTNFSEKEMNVIIILIIPKEEWSIAVIIAGMNKRKQVIVS